MRACATPLRSRLQLVVYKTAGATEHLEVFTRGPLCKPQLLPTAASDRDEVQPTLLLGLCAFGLWPLLAHPITESAEIPYSGPASAEDRVISTLGDESLPEQMFAPQDGAGLRYSTFISGELNRDGVRTTSLLPRGVKREVLLEKQSLLKPYSRLLGIRKQFRKRNDNSECFWKYCV